MFTEYNLQRLMVVLMGLAVCFAAISIVSRSKRADYAETARITVNTFIGIALFSLGAGGIAFATFGKQILQFLGVQV